MANLFDAIRQGIGTTVIAPGGGGVSAASPESDVEGQLRRIRASRIEEAEARRVMEQQEEEREEADLRKMEREVRRAELLATRQRMMAPDQSGGVAAALAESQARVAEMLLTMQQRTDDRFTQMIERMVALNAPKEGGITESVGLVKEVISSVRELIPQNPPAQPLTAQDLLMIEESRWKRDDSMATRVLEDRRRQDERDLRQAAIDSDMQRNGILAGALVEFGKVFGEPAQQAMLNRLGGGQGGAAEAGNGGSAAGQAGRAGLPPAGHAVIVDCPNCGAQQESPMPDGDPMVECQACGASIELLGVREASGQAGAGGGGTAG